MFTRRSRRRRNLKLLDKYPIDGDIRTFRQVHNLLEIWRRLKRSDYNHLPSNALISTRLSVSHANLIELNASYNEQNSLIAENREVKLEQGNASHQTLTVVSLDVFLSDKQMLEIDIESELRLLVNHLQVLYCIFEEEHTDTGGDYYLRVCDYLLRDTVTFTKELIKGGTIEPP